VPRRHGLRLDPGSNPLRGRVVGQHELAARLAAPEAGSQELKHAAWLDERLGGMPEPGREVATPTLAGALASWQRRFHQHREHEIVGLPLLRL